MHIFMIFFIYISSNVFHIVQFKEAIIESKLTKDARSISMVLASNKGKSSGQGPNTAKTPEGEENENVEGTVAAVSSES